MVTRFTIPLGALTEGKITNASLPTFDRFYVFPKAESNLILEESLEDPDNPIRNATTSAILGFTQESMAGRVLDAFNHAADLCRKK
jgi:hypothetical protein